MEPLEYHNRERMKIDQAPLNGNTALQVMQAVYGDKEDLYVSVRDIKDPRGGQWSPLSGPRKDLESTLKEFGEYSLNIEVTLDIPQTENPEPENGKTRRDRVRDLNFMGLMRSRRSYDTFPDGYDGTEPQLSISYSGGTTHNAKSHSLNVRVTGFSKKEIDEAVDKINGILFPTENPAP